MKYMYFFKVKYTKLYNVLQKNYRAQHKLLVNATLVSPMSALASMTGLTGWLQLNKQGDSSGRLVTKVLFLGNCTISLFGGEPCCFDLLLTDYYTVLKTSLPFEDYAIWDHTYVALWFFNCLISLWRLPGVALSLKKKRSALQASRPHGRERHSEDSWSQSWIPYFLSVELGFNLESTVVRGILNSLSFIPDSRAQDSSFHKQNFLDFRLNKNPNSLKCGD